MRFHFRKLLLYFVLQIGTLMGAPMRPDDIEELMRNLRQAKIVRVVERDDE